MITIKRLYRAIQLSDEIEFSFSPLQNDIYYGRHHHNHRCKHKSLINNRTVHMEARFDGSRLIGVTLLSVLCKLDPDAGFIWYYDKSIFQFKRTLHDLALGRTCLTPGIFLQGKVRNTCG